MLLNSNICHYLSLFSISVTSNYFCGIQIIIFTLLDKYLQCIGSKSKLFKTETLESARVINISSVNKLSWQFMCLCSHCFCLSDM